MRVAVRIPYTGVKIISLIISNPEDINNIVDFIADNQDYVEEQIDAGYDENIQYNTLDASVEPD